MSERDTIRAFIPTDGLVIDGDLVDGKIIGQWQQDIKDGAALRRLREALPDDGVGFEMGAWVRREDDPQFPGWGFRVDAEWWTDTEDGSRFHSAHGRGSTIAEAADKCREALEGK